MKNLNIFFLLLILSSCVQEPIEMTSNQKNQWLDEAFQFILEDDRIKAVCYWNQDWEDELAINMRLDSNPTLVAELPALLQDQRLGVQTEVKNSQVVPADNGTYFNVFPGIDVNQETKEVSERTLEAFDELAQKNSNWVTCASIWDSGIKFPARAVELIHSMQKTPYMYMEPWSEIDYSIDGQDPIYNPQAIVDGSFDEALIQFAQEVKAAELPMIIAFGAEPNGDWFPWNGRWNGGGTTEGYGDPELPDGPERYQDAYRHIIDVFRSQEVENVSWAFHIDDSSSPDLGWNQPAQYYPGDDYIDWVGVSIYGPRHTNDPVYSFRQLWEAAEELLSSCSTQKPWAIFEMGVGEF